MNSRSPYPSVQGLLLNEIENRVQTKAPQAKAPILHRRKRMKMSLFIGARNLKVVA